MDKPKASRQGKKLHVRWTSYELPRRINTTKLYPLPSSNGSDIIISGTDKGLHFSWRGGRPLYFTSKSEGPLVNGAAHHEPTEQQVFDEPESDDEALFESDEEELDDDQPYASIVQDFELSLPSPVLHIALPNVPQTSMSQSNAQIPSLLTQNIVLVAACANGSTRLLTLPLDPPSAASKRKRRLAVRSLAMPAKGSRKSVPRDVALTWTSRGSQSMDTSMENAAAETHNTRSHSRSRSHVAAPYEDFDLLIALATSELSGQLHFYRIPIEAGPDRSRLPTEASPAFQTHHLTAFSTRLLFNSSAYPSIRHAHLLVSDTSGCMQVFDPLTAANSTARPSSRDAEWSRGGEHGASLVTLHTSFQMPQEVLSGNPGLARRKSVLDAGWVNGGRGVIALLEDGEWGVWDVEGSGPKSASKPAGSVIEFSLRGFIGNVPETSSTLSSTKKSKSKLAPMTPNTRRVRQESLFSGPTPASGVAARGGLSATPTTASHGTSDDSVILWYNNEAYSIPSLTSLWQRSASSSGRDTGSLFGPGLSRIEGIDLLGESITSVTRFPARTSTPAGLGNTTQQELLVTAEHRLIVLADARRVGPAKSLFSHDVESPSARHDQHLLDHGELDLGGMERLLDGMTGVEKTGVFAKGKRVEFAAH